MVCMELFKVLTHKPIAMMRTVGFDLATNSYTMFEADPPLAVKTQKKVVTDAAGFELEVAAYNAQLKVCVCVCVRECVCECVCV